MKNIKLFEEFLGFGDLKTETISLMQRLIKAHNDEQIEIVGIGKTIEDPFHEMGADDIVISYVVNFERKHILIELHHDNYMTINRVNFSIDGQEVKLDNKEKNWIIKKLEGIEIDWSEDMENGFEEQKRRGPDPEHEFYV